MNIPNHIGFGGLTDIEMPDEMKPFRYELLRRLELFRQNLFDHLRASGNGSDFSIDAVDDATGEMIKVNISRGLCQKEET